MSFTFWWIEHTHTVCVPPDPASTQYLGRNDANMENPTLQSGYYNLNSSYNSFKFDKISLF